MANQELVDILRQGGANYWNTWRLAHPSVLVDLFGADLYGINLEGAIINRADLRGAHLRDANLVGANITRAYLTDADLQHANLSHARLDGVDFSHANLNQAILSQASLYGTLLTGADLTKTNLTRTNLSSALLNGTNLSYAKMGWTIFGDLDLRTVKGLETIKHEGPSTIGTDTILRSEGDIPEIFLRGAGLDDTFISYVLASAKKPIQYYTCFISYSSKDQEFAQRLHNDLQGNGVRCWYAPEDLKIGDKFRVRIDESIRLYDKLLLVLSEDSLASNWVAYEVERALNKEPEGTPNVLFPIRLDKTILACETDWAKDIRQSRHIGDFEHWKDHDVYQEAFQRLLRDLKAQS